MQVLATKIFMLKKKKKKKKKKNPCLNQMT